MPAHRCLESKINYYQSASDSHGTATGVSDIAIVEFTAPFVQQLVDGPQRVAAWLYVTVEDIGLVFPFCATGDGNVSQS